MKELVLPSWAKKIAPGRIEINVDEAYPELLEELELEVDQYGVAVARECAKLDVQFSVAGTEAKAVPGGALIILLSGDKEKWNFKNLPIGKGEEVATKGREAREHYARIRGI